jgi:hypothetical protein
MKTTKMSLANIQGKLSRTEMKIIMAGSGGACVKCGDPCRYGDKCCPGGSCMERGPEQGSFCN